MVTLRQYKFCVILTIFLFLISTEESIPKSVLASTGSKWTAYVLYVKDEKVPVYKNPSEESDTVNFVNYGEKLLIIEEEWMKFGWKKVIYPLAGYVNEKSVMTFEEKSELDIKQGVISQENEKSSWGWEILPCSNNYALVKAQMNEASETVGLLKRFEETVVIKEQYNSPGVWIKTVYPFQGYLKYFEAFGEIHYPYFAIGLTYGAKHIPYEKNLQNYFNPLGGYIEYSNTKWSFSFRLGYVYSESRLSTFFVKTNQVYFHLIYKMLRLFNSNLEVYALTGANYWASSFENTKYGPDNTYFKLEKDSGPGLMLGAGMIYYLNKFYIEAQYNIFISRQAKFGTEPVQGSFANYSTLYPGSNNFEIIIGYRFFL